MTASEPRHALWQQGWYAPACALPSPNFGPRPAEVEIDLLVIHSISLPPGEYGGAQVQHLFTNQLDWDSHPWLAQIRGLQVSAHFYIQRDGKLWQFVSCDDRAWHAGRSNHLGRDNCNDFSIGIELEGLEDGPFEAAQYATLNQLSAAIVQHYPIRHVAGHQHIAPGRKGDPGTQFHWQTLQHALGWPAERFPAQTQVDQG